MYISLSESRDEVLAVARSHGWSLDEVELREVMHRLLVEIERAKAKRVIFDSLSELRLLAQHPLRYRRHISLMKQFF